jgi:alkaline phosphatase D
VKQEESSSFIFEWKASRPFIVIELQLQETKMPDRIQFGSCNSQHYENVMWPHMKSRQPSAFVWVGDAVYADDFEWTPAAERQSIKDSLKRRVKEAVPEDLERLYQSLLKNDGYRTFIQPEKENETGPLIMGTFDDHDYGRNNGDRTYKYKRESAMSFMDFIAKSNKNAQSSEFGTMENRAASGKGLYGVKVLDFSKPPGKQVLSDQEAGLDSDAVPEWNPALRLSDKTVAIFVLDCRSNKTPWPKRSFFAPSTSKGDFLGEEQWRWFKEALRRSTARVNIVVQGLQVHAEHMFDGNIAEEWR